LAAIVNDNLGLVWADIESLRAYERNARTHSDKQIQQVANSIETFGWTNPILVDDRNMILAGHARWRAGLLLGLSRVPVVRITTMTQAQKRAYILADNRLAELAGWDQVLLKGELEFLVDQDLDFDVEVIGFDTADIDIIIGGEPAQAAEKLELPPEDMQPVSRAGDLWSVGKHRILCGNALLPQAYDTLLAGEQAQQVFTDPPYNVPIKGNVSGLGKVVHREFAMASGEMGRPEFTQFLLDALAAMAKVSSPGAIHYVCMDWRHIGEAKDAAEGVYSEIKNLCVWAKTNAGMGTFYRSQHEFVLVCKVGTAPHINNFGLGKKGRYRSNLWTYPGVNTFRAGRSDDLAAHPTVKPVAMVKDAILDCSTRNGIILDGFAGAGTTLIAAERSGRRGYGIEIDPIYVDVIVNRLEKETKQEAILQDGRTFAEVRAERLNEKEAA
jgi:DNA modification methylase